MKITSMKKIFFWVFIGIFNLSYGQVDGVYYTVQSGESLWEIGQKMEVDWREIQRINGLADSKIAIGQQLRIPALDLSRSGARSISNRSLNTQNQGTHWVEAGETLFRISKLYGMTVDEIKRLNGLRGNKIVVGQTLRIYDHSFESLTSARNVVYDNPPANTPATYNPNVVVRNIPTQNRTYRSDIRWITHTVQPGETLYRIQLRYVVPMEELRRINNLSNSKLRAGQVLKIRPNY